MEIAIPVEDKKVVKGLFTLPQKTKLLVIFAHGSGSGRLSPRNQFVASYLATRGIGTLLLDLLTLEEEQVDQITRELRFNIPFLAKRLRSAFHYAKEKYPDLKIAYFGASTGAAAALIAAVDDEIASIVSRGGRPDLAGEALAKVRAPTLLIVGGNDTDVIALNSQAFQQLHCKKKLEIVPGAGHLFEEKGALEEVARLAAEWFLQ